MLFLNYVFGNTCALGKARGKKVERERPSSLALYAFPASAYQWRNKEHYVLAPP